MTRDADSIAFDVIVKQIRQVHAATPSPRHRQVEHLVEVAVVDVTAPVNRNQGAAHDVVEVGIEMSILEETEIAVEFACGDECRAKALNWHVGQNKELVENDVVLLAQYPLVIGLQRGLRGRERGALWVVNEVERKARIAPIAERIEAA